MSLLELTLLFSMLAPGPAQGVGEAASTLRIDPRLLAQAAEVWSIASGDDNPIWPGWNVADTPLLFYFPGEQDVLINHPSPPAGFVPYEGPLSFPGWDIALRNGETQFLADGQNTSRDVGGVSTLVVADTLSNLRPNLLYWMRGEGSDIEKEDALTYPMLVADPYDQMGMILHEAFHVYQGRWGAGKAGNEMALLNYPCLSVDNNVGFALEARALSDALTSTEENDVWLAALRWLAVRQDRRSKLSAEAIAYEDGTEFNEGLAKYTEWALTWAMEGREPSDAMSWVRGFNGYADLSSQRHALIEAMEEFLTGERVVNNDPYGTAPVRFRLYWSGMAIGAMLDTVYPGWKERMMEPNTTLTGLVHEALAPRPADLEAGLAEALDASDYDDLVVQKNTLREEGQGRAAEKVDRILRGEGTLVTVDYSALAGVSPGFSFTPFGITRVDDTRTIYEMTPIQAMLGPNVVRQTRALPVLHDGEMRMLRFRLPRELTPEVLDAALNRSSSSSEEVVDAVCELPDVTLQLHRAAVYHTGDEVVVELR